MTIHPTQALRDVLERIRDGMQTLERITQFHNPWNEEWSVVQPYAGLLQEFMVPYCEPDPDWPGWLYKSWDQGATEAIKAFIELIDAGFDQFPEDCTIETLYMCVAAEAQRYREKAELLSKVVEGRKKHVADLEAELAKRSPAHATDPS
jgi:hypothetical protein